jgi:glycerol kinase
LGFLKKLIMLFIHSFFQEFVMANYILAIDQGTTGSTVSILDQGGVIVAKHNQEYPQIFPKPGWVEHNPEDIWQSVMSSVQKAMLKAQQQSSDFSANKIAGIGITNQRETVVMWDRKTGEPVYNAIVWQCRRTKDFCNSLKKKGFSKWIQKTTGLVTDPYFSASKIRWILKSDSQIQKRAQRGELAVGTIDTFLLWRLTNGASHKTDISNASRTMLMNLKTGQWDDELLKLFSVPRNLLPEICDSSGTFGVTKNIDGLPDGIPIAGIAGDQQAALFGQTCYKIGDVKCTFGTGSFLLMNTGSLPVASKSGMLTTVAWRLPNQKITYAIEGSVFICGAAVQWLRDGLGFINSSYEIEALAKQVVDSGGVEFVPALTGMGAPYWWSGARGLITGLTRGTQKSHIARATLEAMALQNVDILHAMQKDLGKKISSLQVDGGASANNLLMQLQANYLGAKVRRPKQIETTSIGAAYLAGLGVGLWKNTDELKKIWQEDQVFKSEITSKARSQRLESWHRAVQRAR